MYFDSDKPIWSQLVEEFTRRIIAGQWPAASKMPSVRDLAAEVGVNPNTVQKALTELDRSGLTLSERTAGRFVTDDNQRIQSARTQAARLFAVTYMNNVQGVQMGEEEACALLRAVWEESENNG
ncbi:MAG: GntR family transcriptional regulator [Actinomycetaceae bacterium]|nr:GntR family transcriptional regulator [Actinomycetaceae bacterium]